MKRILIMFMLFAILVMSFVGCSSQNTGEVADDSSNSAKAKVSENSNVAVATIDDDQNEQNGWNEDEIIKNLKVTPYDYASSNESHYLILVIENKSEYNCELEVSVDFYNRKGDIVGTEKETIDAFAAKTSTAVSLSCDEKFKKYEYTFTASELDYYTCVTQDLDCKVSTAKEKAIVSVTNNGNLKAEYVTARALFFKNEKLVSSNWTYIADKDSEIKPGKTIKEEIVCYDDFDSVQVYLDGQAENK